MVLRRDQPLLLIEEELVPQGCAKDAAARNTNLEPFNVTGLAVASLIIPANADKLDNYKIDNNGGIIAMGDIPQQPPHAPLVVNNTDNDGIAESDDNDEDAKSNSNNGINDNDDGNLSGNDVDNKPVDLAAATNADDNKSGSNQGVQRLQRKGKGITKKYAVYILLMVARQAKRGSHVGLSFVMGASSFQQMI